MPLVRPLEAKPGPWRRGPPRIDGHDRPGAAGGGFLDQNSADRGIGLAGDERHARLGDPGLLARDPRQRGPQVVGVLQGDLGDDAGERRDDVRGVEAPAQTDLDHGDVHTPGREVREGDGRRGFKETRVEPLDVRLEPARPCG